MPSSKQRRDAERRRLQRQMQRRQHRLVVRRRMLTIISVACVVAVIGIVVGFLLANSGNGTPSAAGNTPSVTAPATTSPATTPPTSPATSAVTSPTTPGTCAFTKSGTPARQVQPPPSHVPTKGTVKAVLDTSQGSLTFTLDRHHAPCTVANFVSLAQQKFFNSTPCHRLTTSGIYVLQCGDPTGTGTGGPGYAFANEVNGAEKYNRGVVAMAHSQQPNSNGSQFFIVYKNSQLPPDYTIFGSVTSGLSVVDKVAAAGVQGGGSDGKPARPITIKSVALKT